MCVRRERELTSMTDGIFGFGTMQGDSGRESGQGCRVQFGFSSVVRVRVGSRDRTREPPARFGVSESG